MWYAQQHARARTRRLNMHVTVIDRIHVREGYQVPIEAPEAKRFTAVFPQAGLQLHPS